MKIRLTDVEVGTVTQRIAARFPTFGGDKKPSGFSPIDSWTEGQPPTFALGVDVLAVVCAVAAEVERVMLERQQKKFYLRCSCGVKWKAKDITHEVERIIKVYHKDAHHDLTESPS